jgi:hypothetical protein
VTFTPKAGDVGLAPGGGWPMRLVRMGTMSRYGHACVAESVGVDGAVGVIEPMPHGCRRRVARAGEFVWSDVALTDEERATVVGYAETTLGMPYDLRAIAGFLTRFWLSKLRVPTSDEAHPRTMMCSALAVRAYRLVHIDINPGKAARATSPGDIDQWLDDRRRAVNRP